MGSSAQKQIDKITGGNVPRTPSMNQQYDQSLRGLENVFLPYEELVAQGRIKQGQNKYNLAPGQSRFGKDLSAFIDQLSVGDPAMAAYRKMIMGGIEGLESGMPSDFRRSLTEEVRSAQAARGIIDSDTAAIEESARLMGGSEYIRSSRLNDLQNYLSGVTSMGVNAIFPGIGQMLSGQANVNQQNLQRGINQSQIYSQYALAAADVAAAGAGLGGGTFAGGGF